jgi:hypothetical protein
MEQLGISRELPKADPAEVAAASGTKTRSNPGSAVKTPPRPSPKPALKKPTPGPGTRAQPQATQLQPPPPPPARARTGLFVGVGAGALIVIGVVVFLAMQQMEESRRTAEATRAAVQRMEDSRKAAEAAKEREKQQQDQVNAKVSVSVVSDPLGALCEATWKDGAKAGLTPLEIEVPKNVKIHLAFSKKEYLPYVEERIADAAQLVKVTLQAEPRVVAARPVPESKRPREPKAQPVKAEPASKDDIPVEF